MAQDIIDAEFETIRRDDGRHPVRSADNDVCPKAPAPGTADRDAGDQQIGILKQMGGIDGLPSRRAQILYALSVLFSAFFAFYISGGHVLFDALPAAPGDNPLALEVTPAPEVSGLRDSTNVITVSATIRNGSSGNRRVPDVLLTFTSAADDGNLVFRVPRGETLAPGKSLAFTVRMPKKPGYAQAPRLTFDNSGV